jgi:N-hydroxyarylamine O-acetyltransferase
MPCHEFRHPKTDTGIQYRGLPTLRQSTHLVETYNCEDQMSFSLSDYLDRIGHGAAAPSPKALKALQAAQLAAIPFENTEPLMGIVPDLRDDAIWHKLVVERRGGYCLELNALFGMALHALGYQADPILGRVRMGAPIGGIRSHLAHVVTFGDLEFLADVGFGGPAPEEPLQIGSAVPQVDRLGTFRLSDDAATGETVLERKTPGGWFALYGFDRCPVTDADRAGANFFCAKSPESPFPNHIMLNRVTTDGRVSLFNLRLSASEGDRTIESPSELAKVLSDRFGLNGAELAPRLWTGATTGKAA